MYSKRGGNILHNESAMSESKHMVERIIIWNGHQKSPQCQGKRILLSYCFLLYPLCYSTKQLFCNIDQLFILLIQFGAKLLDINFAWDK